MINSGILRHYTQWSGVDDNTLIIIEKISCIAWCSKLANQIIVGSESYDGSKIIILIVFGYMYLLWPLACSLNHILYAGIGNGLLETVVWCWRQPGWSQDHWIHIHDTVCGSSQFAVLQQYCCVGIPNVMKTYRWSSNITIAILQTSSCVMLNTSNSRLGTVNVAVHISF